MARTVLHSMRHRKRRWIALLAAFALLFNQIALAQHLCLYRHGELPQLAFGIDHDGAPVNCHAADVAAKPGPTDTDGTACAAHCNDGDKQSRGASSLKVPDLFAAVSELALLRPTRDGPFVVAIAETARPAHARRTIDYGVLLI